MVTQRMPYARTSLTLTFRTGTTKLRVSIDGTMTSTVAGISYITTLHASNILLSKTADPPVCSADDVECTSTFAGSGPATAQVIIPIPDCSKPYVEKGPFKLKAKHIVVAEGAGDSKWEISWDPSTTLSFKGGCASVCRSIRSSAQAMRVHLRAS